MDVSTEHYAVGPVNTESDHTAVVMISSEYPDVDDSATDGTLFVCLDCGFMTTDQRWFRSIEPDCEREDNPVPKTLREEIGDFEV